jgi:hypothetical protein
MTKKAVKPEVKQVSAQESYPVRLAKIQAHALSKQIQAKELRKEAYNIEQDAEILLLKIQLEGQITNINQNSELSKTPATNEGET